MIDAIKFAEDSIRVLLRLHEFAGRSGPVEIACEFPVRSWQECNLLETPVSPAQQDGTLRFVLQSYGSRRSCWSTGIYNHEDRTG
jgi:alpha-mannosidase